LFAGDNNIPLSEFAFSRRALTFISLGHIALVGILALAVLRGLILWLKEKNTSRTQLDSQ
jgi:hypothetical protein